MSYATSNLSRSVFVGLPAQDLQRYLAEAQRALIRLQMGEQEVTLSYAEGEGTRTVSFQKTSVANLTQLIAELQACLGIRPRARAGLRFSY